MNEQISPQITPNNPKYRRQPLRCGPAVRITGILPGPGRPGECPNQGGLHFLPAGPVRFAAVPRQKRDLRPGRHFPGGNPVNAPAPEPEMAFKGNSGPTYPTGRLLPAAAQRPVQVDEGKELTLAGFSQLQFGFQYAALGRDHFQVRGVTAHVEVVGRSDGIL